MIVGNRTIAILLGAALAVPAVTASAAGADGPPDSSIETVVVTGSLIARPDYVSESPIVTASRSQIEASGAVTVESALNRLPQFTASATASSNTQPRGGQANLDLRGLGQQRTLVLLDGRRMEPSNTDGSIDLNTIPDSLIDNVEVITGGASAVYGSDAIAGVVNFKMRHDFSGIEIRGQLGETGQGDGTTESASVTLGGNFAGDRGNAVVALTYANRSPVFGRDRPFFAVSVLSTNFAEGAIKPVATNLPSQSAVNSIFQSYGIAPGTVPRTATFGFNSDGTLFSQGSPAVHLTDNLGNLLYVSNNTYFYNTGLDYYLQLPLTRYSAFGRAEYDVTPDIKAYAQVYYTTYTARTQIVPVVAGGSGVPAVLVPYNNPFVPANLAALLASRPSPTAAFSFTKRLSEVGNRVQNNNWNVYQFMLGLSGGIPGRDWTWDISATRGQTLYDETDTGFPSLSALQQLLSAPDGGLSLCPGGYNPFGLTTLSTGCQTFLQRTVKNQTVISQTDAKASLQGKMLDLPAGELRFALGAEYRENTYDYSPDSLLVHLDLVNAKQTLPSRGKTTVKEVYGELLVPVLRDLPLVDEMNLDLAFRYSDYNSIGGVNTYKASIDWKAVDWLRFRGGYQRAIRAPNVGELYSAATPTSELLTQPGSIGTGDPCDVRGAYRATGYAGAPSVRALCLAQGVPAALIDTYRNINTGISTASGGNPLLNAEFADTFSLGFVARPDFANPIFSDLSLSVDYYDISLKGAIGNISGTSALAKCFNADGSNPAYSPANFYCSLISRESATGLTSVIQTPLVNLGGYRTSGVDIEADWRVALPDAGLGDGTLSLNVLASYLRRFTIRNLAGGSSLDYAGTIGNTQIDLYADAHPDWKTLTTLSYGNGPVTASVRWRFVDSMTNASNVGTTGTVRGVSARNYFDLDAVWNVSPDIDLGAGIVNLLDVAPPLVGVTPGATSQSTYDLLGRQFFVRITARQ
ncbi:MAG: TonB-dependent receptor [Rhizomicrobium sp.]